METKICKLCKLEKNINEFRIINKKYFFSYCKECEKIKSKKYRESHIEERKQYYQKNKEKFNEQKRIKYKENINKEKLRIEKYRKENKELIKIRRKKYDNIPLNKMKIKIRGCIRDSFRRKGLKKSIETEKILGISLIDFYNYLLKTFKNNYGYEWDGKEKVHIDHIIPLVNAKNENEIIKLCHYTNLQLLKEKDNLKKRARL